MNGPVKVLLRCLAGAVLFCWVLICLGIPCDAQEEAPKRAAVLISQEIRPYIEAAEGLSLGLKEGIGAEVQVHSLEDFRGKSRVLLSRELLEKTFDVMIGVGPGAARFMWSEVPGEQAIRLFTMVLNPDRVLPRAPEPCGVPLNIPAKTQMDLISRALPACPRVGVLFDPSLNAEFFDSARAEAAALNRELLPLEVSERKNIPEVLQDHWGEMDALWLIPDSTVISETLVQYMIKEALYREVPVIGYNRFFYESGCALAFVFDYRELGRQCAREAIRALSGGPCRQVSPVFEAWVNTRVFGNIGMALPEQMASPLVLGP